MKASIFEAFFQKEQKKVRFGLNENGFSGRVLYKLLNTTKTMNELYLTRRQQIETDKILYLESEVNYTNIYTTSRLKIIAAHTLGVLQSRLNKNSFIRVNRSHIINLSQISTYRHENNKLIIQLKGGKEFTASRRRLKTFQNIFTN